MFTQATLAAPAVFIETSSTVNTFTLSVRNIPDCWHHSNFTVTTLHYTPTNATNPKCHDELQSSRFALHLTLFFLICDPISICDATSCHGRTNPRKPWIARPSWAGVTWYLYFQLWVFGVKLATFFVVAPVFFRWLPNFLNTCTYVRYATFKGRQYWSLCHALSYDRRHRSLDLPQVYPNCYLWLLYSYCVIFWYEFRK
jgi:hypothetical protein